MIESSISDRACQIERSDRAFRNPRESSMVYTRAISSQKREVQGKLWRWFGMNRMGCSVGQLPQAPKSKHFSLKGKSLVGAIGFEPMTSTV
jgi:hypothetical protein